MDTVHSTAAEIAVDGFQWQQDGWKVFAIVKELAAGFTAVANEDLEKFLVEGLKALDREYGWDLPGRSQQQEDDLYGMFVSLYLSTRAE